MIVNSHAPENRRTPRRNADLNGLAGIIEGVAFGAVIWVILIALYGWVRPALDKPENPVARVKADFMSAISGGGR